MPVPVTIVDACLRDGRGGSPTAVVADPAPQSWTDTERRRVPVRHGTSHAVFVTRPDRSGTPGAPVDLRFFTAAGELPACGHGTVAALAFLAGPDPGAEREFTLRVSGRTFTGRAAAGGDLIRATFDPGRVALRDPDPAEAELVVAALRVDPDLVAPGLRVAALGRARMLVPLTTAQAVVALAPDLDRLRAACDRFGLLGCYVHARSAGPGRLVARMFAPSIGVPEDIANANSTACLAAAQGGDLAVDMGDALGRPATVIATARRYQTGLKIMVGGTASVRA